MHIKNKETSNMKKIALLLLLFLITTSLAVAAETPTEESLIKAWEQVQKHDGNTMKFEKIADRRYKFKTKLFPFDGELRILNVVIGPVSWDRESGSQEGAVDLDLIGLPDNFYRKYSNSYDSWAKNNTLYFYPPVAKWLINSEFQDSIAQKNTPPQKAGFCIGDYIWYIVYAGIIVIFIWSIKRQRTMQNKIMALSERAISLSDKNLQQTEETNRVLKEILNFMKNNKDSR
jgi:hypothetical protein